jgi:RND family efflux transporter MFP subunit
MTENVVQGPSAQWLRSRVLYPLIIIGAALGLVVLLLRSSAPLDTSQKTTDPIVIRSQTVFPEPISLQVKSEGTVQAAVGSALVAQVTGEVLYVAPNLKAGGRFLEGESLLRIDPRDYESALASAEAQLERARAEAQFFDAEWRRLEQLSSDKMVSESQRRNAERGARVSQATLKDAEAQLSRARLDLERTHIRAPFNGRVSREQVDVGQFVQRGTELAAVYGTDTLEVRLPLADSQLAFLDPEILRSGNYPEAIAPRVTLEADFAGATQRWEAALVRSEGLIDRKSRVVYLIAQVTNPMSDRGVMLPAGLFVEASITGLSVPSAVSVPRSAIREGDQVLVVDGGNTLRFRSVEILRYQDGEAVITAGLAAGETVCLSNLQFVVEGMPVALEN